jgi:hypothetical protein
VTNNFTSNRLRASVLWFGTMGALLSWPVALLISRLLGGPSWAGLTLAAVLATTLSSILFWWLFIVRPEHVSILRGVLAGIVSIIAATFLMWWFCGVYGTAYAVVIQHQHIDALLGAVLATTLSNILFWWLFIFLPEHNSILRGVLAGVVSIIAATFLMLCFYGVYLVVIHDIHIIDALFVILLYPLLTMLFVCITPLGWLFFPIGGIAGGLLAWCLRRIVASEANLEQKRYCGCSRKIVPSEKRSFDYAHSVKKTSPTDSGAL